MAVGVALQLHRYYQVNNLLIRPYVGIPWFENELGQDFSNNTDYKKYTRIK